jgi:uncharacterized protein (TIGR02145 family)
MKKNNIIWIYPLILMGVILFFTNSCKKDDNDDTPPVTTVSDYDGNVYNTVTIGTQVWMTENLKVTHYRNGDPIPNVNDNTAWSTLTTGAYCNYNNTSGNGSTYGLLYNWYAVADSRNIAPAGWHVPTETEWLTLINYLGDSAIAGGKLKETGTTHWTSPNTGATNETGFTALPGGYRNGFSGTFTAIGVIAYLWTSTESSTVNAWFRYLDNGSGYISRSTYKKSAGFSVRCIKD